MTISPGAGRVPRARISESCAYLPRPGARQSQIIPTLIARATIYINHALLIEAGLTGDNGRVFISCLSQLRYQNRLALITDNEKRLNVFCRLIPIF
jgi:hypothetical protein